MIDFHCHLLPGVDDGPETLSESLAMCEVARKDGIETIVATPHFTEQSLDDAQNRYQEILIAYQQLTEALVDIPLEVVLGFEVALFPELPILVSQLPELSIAGLNKHLLVELPFQEYPRYSEQAFFELQTMGITPIIAHPERNLGLQSDPALLGTLVERGILAQATASSFLGKSGRKARRTLEDWCKKGYIHIVGTDAHSPRRRPPTLTPSFKVLRRWVGVGRIEWMLDAPKSILAGEEVEANLWVNVP
jgi:protein-tyrosine phosphatase